MIGSNSTLSASNIIKPTWKDCDVWIDANDYSVGTFSNGAPITNKGNNSATFTVVGSTLEVQLDGSGNKEFEFNGSYIRCSSSSSAFTKYHNLATSYSLMVIGKFGTSSNPDAIFSICGNNAAGSANIGTYLYVDNRTAVSAAIRGVTRLITKGSSGNSVFNSPHLNGAYNTEQSLWFNLILGSNSGIDQDLLFKDGDIVSIADRVRTTANTTSGLGGINNASASTPTYAFEIGAAGNGTVILASGSTMKQFVMFGELLNTYDIRGIDAYFNKYWSRGNTTIRAGGATIKQITDGYILGGFYHKSTDRSKTTLVTSKGADHFAVGTDGNGVQIMSTDDAATWPSSFSSVFTDATKSVMPVYGGYNTGTGTLLAFYSKWTTATGTYTDLVCRRSTDNGTTWGSEIPITLPTTSPALTAWLPHDQLVVCNNGDVMMPMYAVSTTSLYKVYIMRSTDDGLNWTFTQVYTSGSAYISEPSLCSLGGGNHLMACRIEVAAGGIFKYKLFLSADDGATWPTTGDTSFGGALYAHPPMLRLFDIDGTPVVEFNWVNRNTRRWHMKYATAASVISTGVTVFNSKTTYTVLERLQGESSTVTGWASGYPFIIHSRGDLNMQGAWFEETSSSTTNVAIQYFNDEMKTAIKTELGI